MIFNDSTCIDEFYSFLYIMIICLHSKIDNMYDAQMYLTHTILLNEPCWPSDEKFELPTPFTLFGNIQHSSIQLIWYFLQSVMHDMQSKSGLSNICHTCDQAEAALADMTLSEYELPSKKCAK